MRHRCIFLFCMLGAALFFVVGPLQAQTIDSFLSATSGTGDFATASNWSSGTVPGAAAGYEGHIEIGACDHGLSPFTPVVQTANLNSSATYINNLGEFRIGSFEGGVGTLNIDGGAAFQNLSGYTQVGRFGGRGTMNINDGSFSSPNYNVILGMVNYGNNSPAFGTIYVGENGVLEVGYLNGQQGNAGAGIYLGQGANNGCGALGELIVDSGGTFRAGQLIGNAFGGGYGSLTVKGNANVYINNKMSVYRSGVTSRSINDEGSFTIRCVAQNGTLSTIDAYDAEVVINFGTSLGAGPGGGHSNQVFVPDQRGGTEFDLDFEGTVPTVGTSYDVLGYGTLLGAEFNCGKYFVNEDGYGVSVAYGAASSWDKISATVVSDPGDLLQFNFGTTNTGVGQGSYGKGNLVWNDLGVGTTGTTSGGLQNADGSAATGVTVTINADGTGGKTMHWKDTVESAPEEMTSTWIDGNTNGSVDVTIGGIEIGSNYNVEVFSLDNEMNYDTMDITVNGLFTCPGVGSGSDPNTLLTLPQHGDGYNAFLDGYSQCASLAFLDITPDANGDIVISLDGNAPFVQGIRLTSLGGQAQMQADVVPEPSTLVGLAMLALAGLFRFRRRFAAVLILLVVIVALSGSLANAQVTDNYFQVANGDFETAANWSFGIVPGNPWAENSHIHIGTPSMLDQTCNFSGTGSYVLTNPSLLTLGEGAGSVGTLNITGGGLLSVAGQVVLDFTDPNPPYPNHQPLYIGHNAGQGYLNVDNGMFCATQWDIYVGNSPTGASSLDGSYGEINVGENGTLYVGYDSTGTKITTPITYSDGSTGSGYAALMLGCGDYYNKGVLNVNGGTVKTQKLYLSFGQGQGEINVRGDSTVSLGGLDAQYGRKGSRTVWDGNNVGICTVRAVVKDGVFNPINVENLIVLSGPRWGHDYKYSPGIRGGAQFDMDFEGTAPTVGDTFTVVDYSTSGTGSYYGAEFNFGSYFVNEDGYGMKMNYDGLGTWDPETSTAVLNSTFTAEVVADSSQLLQLNLGTANAGVTQNTYGKGGLTWNDIGATSGTLSNLQVADGGAASGVTVTIAGVGSKATMPLIGWDDVVESTPDAVIDTRMVADSNNLITVTIGGLDTAGTFNVEVFAAEEAPVSYLENIKVNGVFADGTTSTLPEQGNWYSPYTDCYAQGAGLNFYDVMTDTSGNIIITIDGFDVTMLEAIRLTDLDSTISSDIPGDANHDQKVDASDATILAGNWQAGPGASWEMGDFNGDGYVDASDATILAGNWQAGTGNTAVPEPSTIIMICSALGLLLVFRRRK